MVYRNKEGYADPTAGAAIHETEPKAKKREYNPEVTNLVTPDKYLVEWLKPNHIIKIKKTAGTDDRK